LLLVVGVVVVVGLFSLCFFAGASFRCFLFCWLASFRCFFCFFGRLFLLRLYCFWCSICCSDRLSHFLFAVSLSAIFCFSGRPFLFSFLFSLSSIFRSSDRLLYSSFCLSLSLIFCSSDRLLYFCFSLSLSLIFRSSDRPPRG
jgi:hypothetical protein